MISVPNKLWIGLEDTVNHPVFSPIFSDRQLAPFISNVDIILATRLLYEKLKEGEKSFWEPWLQTLSPQSNSTVFWSEQHLALIEGTNLLDRTKSHRAQIKLDYDNLFHKLFKKFPDVFHKRSYTLKLFEWALGFVWAHRIDLDVEGRKATYLVPLVDLCNHSHTSQLAYKLAGDSITVSGPGEIAAGEQVLVNYNKPNDVLLHLYGFAVDGNPKDQVEIFAMMDPKQNMYEHKCNLLRQAGISNPNGPFSLKYVVESSDAMQCSFDSFAFP